MAVMSLGTGIAHASPTTLPASGVTQTHATLSGTGATGFQVKYGTLVELDEIAQNALSPDSDPVAFTLDYYPWKKRNGWIESYYNTSSPLPVNTGSAITAEVTLTEETTVSFEWGVDSEEGIGNLSFIVDGQTLGSISGLVDFTGTSFTIAPGTHTLKWEYRKTAVTNVGMDLAKLRNIDLRNTTPGEWISMDAHGGSVTVDDLYPGQDYIFRAVDASGNRSGLKQFRTLDITIGDMTIDPITQTTATVSVPIDYGDAQVETGVVYTDGYYFDYHSKALLSLDTRFKDIMVDVDPYWRSSNDCLVFGYKFNDRGVTASFEMQSAGEISFDASATNGRLNFYIDGSKKAEISGNKQRYTYSLSAGRHTLKWTTYYTYSNRSYHAEIGNLSIPHVPMRGHSISATATDKISTKIEGLTSNSKYSVRPLVNLTYSSRFENKWNHDKISFKNFATLPVIADTLPVADLRQASVTLRGKVMGGDAEIIARGLQYKDATGARWTDFPADAAAGEEISAKVTRLRPATKYDYRAYIQAIGCDTVFSITGSFTTEAVQALKPILLSSTQHTAKIQGEIVAGDAQIYQRGMQIANFSYDNWRDIEDSGTDAKFTLESTGLDYNTTYKVRTYVQAAGCDIIYSDTLKFSTLPIRIEVDSVINITQRSATIHYHTDRGDQGIDRLTYKLSVPEARYADRNNSFEYGFFGTQMPFDYEIIHNDWTKGSTTERDATLKMRIMTFVPGRFYYGGGCKNGAILDFFINGEHIKKDSLYTNHPIYTVCDFSYDTDSIYPPGTYELEWQATDVHDWVALSFRLENAVFLIESSNDDFSICLNKLSPGLKYRIAIKAYGGNHGAYLGEFPYDFSTPPYFSDVMACNVTQSKATLQAQVVPTEDTIEDKGFILVDSNGIRSTIVGNISDDYMKAEISGLSTNTNYTLRSYAKVDGNIYEGRDTIRFTTPPVDIHVDFNDVTQTKANMTITYDNGDATVDNLEYNLDGSEYVSYHSKVSFTALTPSKTYIVSVQGMVNGSSHDFGSYSFKTAAVSISPEVVNSWATSAQIEMNEVVGDATLVSSGINYSTDLSYDNRIECDADNMVLITELDPTTTYHYRAWTETAEGGIVVKEGTFRTSAITCRTSAADNISNRSARLNGMIDCDANSSAEFGFEWKRMTGWASDPAFTKGIKNDDGTISVSLINGMLDPDTDYQFRAAVRYKGKMYHASEWKNFRTENEFILYPGTVYTLYRTDRENNAIIFCGYYVAGSETVTAQGYEYWHNGGASAPAMNAPATVETVYTGEDMQYTLPAALLADGNYSVRAFIETESGKTYGQTLSFGIENGGPSSIIDIESAVIQCRPVNGQIVMSNVSGLAVRICDTTGRTIFYKENLGETEYFDAPRNTICLLRFSNGMTFKIMP